MSLILSWRGQGDQESSLKQKLGIEASLTSCLSNFFFLYAWLTLLSLPQKEGFSSAPDIASLACGFVSRILPIYIPLGLSKCLAFYCFSVTWLLPMCSCTSFHISHIHSVCVSIVSAYAVYSIANYWCTVISYTILVYLHLGTRPTATHYILVSSFIICKCFGL